MRTRGRTTTATIDGRAPARTVEPADESEVARLLQEAAAAAEAVVPIGGGTLLGIGNAPRRYDVALSTTRLGSVHLYDPRDLTIGAGAGMRVAELNAALAQHRQFVPLDVPRPAAATIGGTLASGWLGPRRGAYGRPRDLLIGTTTVLADGTIAHAGGMTVKNVSGYDLSKIYIGSLGTLGVIVRANFKTLPMPAQVRLAIAPLPERTRLRAAHHVQQLEIEPTAALLVEGFRDVLPFELGAEGALVLAFEGSAAAVERATRGMRSALGAAGVPETRIVDTGALETFARIVDAYVAPIAGRSITLRSLGPPGSVLERDAAARRALEPTPALLDSIVDLQNGDLIERVFVDGKLDKLAIRGTLSDAVAALRTVLPEAAMLARGAELDGEIDAWGAPPAAVGVMREIKARFDPRGTLAPGRLVGGI